MIGPRTKAYATRKDREQDRKIRQIQSVVGTRELRYQDTAATGVVPTWAGALGNLIGPAEGVTDITRVGDKIAVEGIYFRYNGGMSGTGANQVRFIILRDKSNGIGTTVANVLDSGTISTANAAQSPWEEDLRKNFEVLYDKTHMVDAVTNYQFQGQYIKKFKKPKILMFNNNTTTVNKGQIKLLTISDLLAPNVAYDYVCRVFYSDM